MLSPTEKNSLRCFMDKVYTVIFMRIFQMYYVKVKILYVFMK